MSTDFPAGDGKIANLFYSVSYLKGAISPDFQSFAGFWYPANKICISLIYKELTGKVFLDMVALERQNMYSISCVILRSIYRSIVNSLLGQKCTFIDK